MNPELEALLASYKQTKANAEMSPDDKDKLLRQLRRKIRQAGGSVREQEDSTAPSPAPTAKPADADPAQPQPSWGEVGSENQDLLDKARRRQRKAKEESPISWQADPAAFQNFVNQVLIVFSNPLPAGYGVESVTEEVAYARPVYGVDLALAYEDHATPEDLIVKYRARWANHSPEYMCLSSKAGVPLLLLGPLPNHMAR